REAPRNQRGSGGADPRVGRPRRDRRPARDRARHLGGAQKGARGIDVLAGALGLAVLLAVSGGLFARRALFLTRLVRLGKPVDRRDDVPARLRNEATIVLGQRKLLYRLVPGLMPAFIFCGVLGLFPTIVMAMIAAVDQDASFPWLGSQGWFMLLVDVFAVLVLVGVAAALVIRKVARPARFEGSHLGEADLILGMIAGVVVTLLLWHA